MTSMPQLVAILHSFVGAAAVLVGIATALDHTHGALRRRSAHPRDRDLPRRVRRRGDVHRIGDRLRQAAGPDRQQAAAAARPAPDQPDRDPGVRVPGLPVRHLTANTSRRCGRCYVVHRGRLPARHSPGDGDRRRRHAGRGLDAQQLFGLGRGGRGLHARERPADHHRRAGRIERRDPQLHHVSAR